MVRPSRAAAKRTGARSFAAVAYQNSPSGVVPSAFAVSQRSAAVRVARRQSAHPESGDHVLGGTPVAAVGSTHHTRPRSRRRASVSRSKSDLTLAATTGPRQSRMAGTARLVVLPLCVGPTTTSDWFGSAATVRARTVPGMTPSVSRPEAWSRVSTRSGRRSRRRAHRAPRRRSERWRFGRRLSRDDTPATSTPARASGSAEASSPLTSPVPTWRRRCRRWPAPGD